MNVETAVANVRAALAGISGFPAVSLRFVHPDDVGAANFPFCCLLRDRRERERSGSGRTFTSRMRLEVYYFINASTDNDTLAEELDRVSDKVDDAIWDLDETSNDLNCQVESDEPEVIVNPKWAGILITILVSFQQSR